MSRAYGISSSWVIEGTEQNIIVVENKCLLINIPVPGNHNIKAKVNGKLKKVDWLPDWGCQNIALVNICGFGVHTTGLKDIH